MLVVTCYVYEVNAKPEFGFLMFMFLYVTSDVILLTAQSKSACGSGRFSKVNTLTWWVRIIAFTAHLNVVNIHLTIYNQLSVISYDRKDSLTKISDRRSVH